MAVWRVAALSPDFPFPQASSSRQVPPGHKNRWQSPPGRVHPGLMAWRIDDKAGLATPRWRARVRREATGILTETRELIRQVREVLEDGDAEAE